MLFGTTSPVQSRYITDPRPNISNAMHPTLQISVARPTLDLLLLSLWSIYALLIISGDIQHGVPCVALRLSELNPTVWVMWHSSKSPIFKTFPWTRTLTPFKSPWQMGNRPARSLRPWKYSTPDAIWKRYCVKSLSVKVWSLCKRALSVPPSQKVVLVAINGYLAAFNWATPV